MTKATVTIDRVLTWTHTMANHKFSDMGNIAHDEMMESKLPGQSSSGRPTEPFKGYTLEEIRYLKLVNAVKIRVIEDRLKDILFPKSSAVAQQQGGSEGKFSFRSMVRYVDMAIVGYGAYRKLRRWIGKMRGAFR